MKRALKVLVPLVILAEATLVWSGAMDLGDAVLLVAVLEALLFVAGLGGLVLVVGRYRKERRAGTDAWRALEDSLSLVLPRVVARLAVKEPRLLVCLSRWAFRRVKLTNHEFAYHKRSLLRAIVPLLVVSGPVELLVVHVLALAFSPWWWLKWALLVLGAYATLWLLGLYASLVALPHRLEVEGLRLRYGLLAEGFLPLSGDRERVANFTRGSHLRRRPFARIRRRNPLPGFGRQDGRLPSSPHSVVDKRVLEGYRAGLPRLSGGRRARQVRPGTPLTYRGFCPGPDAR